MMEPRIDSKT